MKILALTLTASWAFASAAWAQTEPTPPATPADPTAQPATGAPNTQDLPADSGAQATPAAPAAQPAGPNAAASSPRTHINTTVVGDAAEEGPTNPDSSANLDNDHQFEAGAPRIVAVTKQLNLTVRQKAQLNDLIERFDAGAAVLIKREHDVQNMIQHTTPEDPLYAKLIVDQSSGAERWRADREKLQADVRAILTPAQQAKFDRLQAEQAKTE